MTAAVDWPASFFAARRRRPSAEDLRFRRAPSSARALVCVLLDCSASMLAGGRLALAKGVLAHWVTELYRQRAEMVVIGFAGRGAFTLREAGRVGLNERGWLNKVGGGGATPLAAAVRRAARVAKRARANGRRVELRVLTDGRMSALPERPREVDACLVVDLEQAAVPLGRARRLARRWEAGYWRVEDGA